MSAGWMGFSSIHVLGCLELRLVVECHRLAVHRMAEREAGGVEHQSLCGVAIEVVAYDGARQPVGMGAVDAQLVGAPRQGVKLNSVVGQHAVVGDGLMPVCGIHELAWAVGQVGAQGQGDAPLAGSDNSLGRRFQ